MFQKDGGDYATYYEEEVTITAAKKTYEIEFTMENDVDALSRIVFNFAYAGQTGNIKISNVKVVLLGSDGDTKVARQTLSQTVTKNSSLRVTAKKSGINVRFKAKSSGAAELRVYGLKGDLVAKTKMQTVAGKTYAHTFNAGKLANGFYVVSVNNNGVVERSRAIMPK
jgi:hypothetical protein